MSPLFFDVYVNEPTDVLYLTFYKPIIKMGRSHDEIFAQYIYSTNLGLGGRITLGLDKELGDCTMRLVAYKIENEIGVRPIAVWHGSSEVISRIERVCLVLNPYSLKYQNLIDYCFMQKVKSCCLKNLVS